MPSKLILIPLVLLLAGCAPYELREIHGKMYRFNRYTGTVATVEETKVYVRLSDGELFGISAEGWADIPDLDAERARIKREHAKQKDEKDPYADFATPVR